MYEEDPFAARRSVDERQGKAAKKKEAGEKGAANQGVLQTSPEFVKCPETRMASGLRDLVEDSIKQVSKYGVGSSTHTNSCVYT